MKIIRKSMLFTALLALTLLLCFPIWFAVTGAFSAQWELEVKLSPVFVNTDGMAAWSVLPAAPTLKSLVEVLLDSPGFFTMFWNSVMISLGVLGGQLLTAVPAAWALARFPLRGKKRILTAYVVLMLMPFQVLMFPQYLVLQKCNLLDTLGAVILPAIFSTFPVFILHRFFKAIPQEILEAARLDGAGDLRIFCQIGIPMGAPGIISVCILTFLDSWNMIEQPMTYIKNQVTVATIPIPAGNRYGRNGRGVCGGTDDADPGSFAVFGMPGVFGTGNRYVGRKRLVMYLKKEKKSIGKWIGLFFGTMILFTILSRAIYQHSTAVVTTKMPTSGTINHTVQITGKTVRNQELAVTTIGGLRIASICVNEGQQVKQGDVLFVLDLDYLDEVILKQEQNMKKQQLSVWDAWAQNSNAQKQKENQQAQAEENYDNAVAKAQTAVDRAKRDLERAKTALENYRNGVTDAKAEEEALELACQEARTDYNNAVAALEALEQEIDQAVQNAISQAETELQQTALQSATQPPAETILTEETGSTEETTVPVEPVETAEQTPIATELSPEQKAEIEASVRVSYSDSLFDAETAVQTAQQAVTDADAELEALEQEIDQAVQNAISQAETELQQTALQSATQTLAETILTEETGGTEVLPKPWAQIILSFLSAVPEYEKHQIRHLHWV